jgi:Peptidase A4 family
VRTIHRMPIPLAFIAGLSVNAAAAAAIETPRTLSIAAEPGSVCEISAPDGSNKGRPLTVFADASGHVRLNVANAAAAAPGAALSATCRNPAGLRKTSSLALDRAIIPPERRATPRLAQLVARGTMGVLSPMRLDVAKAAAADLLKYGYPTRPDPVKSPKAYKLWLYAVTTPGVYVRAQPLRRPGIVHGPLNLHQVSSLPVVSVEQARTVMQQSGPVIRHGAGGGGTTSFSTSQNWSGYVATTGLTQYNWVSGGWVVSGALPAPNQVGIDYSSEWVGLDGYGTNDLIQAGTESDVMRIPTWGHLATISNNYAWYEYYPDFEIAVPGLGVSPGDSIWVYAFVDTAPDGHTRGNFLLLNNTTNHVAATSEEIPSGTTSPLNSAEWILERTQIDGTYPALADYGTAQMSETFYGGAMGSGSIGFSSEPRLMQQVAMTRDGSNTTTLLSFAHAQGSEAVDFVWEAPQ